MSRIVIAAIGTRGDVGPGIYLAGRLAGSAAGRHEVVLVAPPENEQAVRAAGVDFRPIGARFCDVVVRGSLAEYREQIALQFREHLDRYKGADLLVGISLFYAGRAIAERFGLPYRHVFFTPQVFRSPSTTPPSARRMSRSPVVNGLLWRRHLAQEGFIVGRVVNEGRVRLGLKPLRHTEQARTGPGTVLAVDPLFARLPDDVVKGGGAGIWQAHYWYHEGAETALDDGTARFLDAGDPPVMVSFGSADSLVKDAAAAYARLCDSLTGRGLRVLLVSAVPVHPVRQDAVHQTAFVPHVKAMPRCRLVIHHGGIGTVFAAARAGVPQLVVPRMLDQFYWAARVSEMQIGYGLLPAADPGAPVIGTAVDRLLADEVVAQRVRAARDALTSPDRAVEVDAAVRDIFSVT